MILTFCEEFRLPISDVFSYFRSPLEWPRLYGRAGAVREVGDGWVSVPIKGSPFPLVAKVVRLDADRCVRWEFRGFWRGEGELHFAGDTESVAVAGYEEIAVRPLGPLSVVIEKAFLERAFRDVWELGWRRLRHAEQAHQEALAGMARAEFPRG